jgi:putative hydrolase of HD superfamily
VTDGGEPVDREHAQRTAAGLAGFAFEMGVLKRLRRAGWWHAGVRDPESVAEHSLRVSQLATLIATQEGADPARAALLAIWHDSQETRTGDLPHTARPYLTTAEPSAITADQTARLPDTAAKTIREAVAEYEARTTIESRCAHDADKLECLLQAIEYRTAGNTNVQGWINSSRRALTTDTAARIADAALAMSPLAWRDR